MSLAFRIHTLATKPLVIKAFHTFWQAAGGVLLSGLLVAHSSGDVKLAVAAALAAGLSALKTYVVTAAKAARV